MQKLSWWYHLSVQRMKKTLKQRGKLKCKASDTKWDPGGQMPDSKSCEWPSTKSWLAVCLVLPLPQKVFTFPLNLLDTWGQRRPELSRLEAKNRDRMLVCNQISVGMCCVYSCVLFHKKKKIHLPMCKMPGGERPRHVHKIYRYMLPKYRLFIWLQEFINICNLFSRAGHGIVDPSIPLGKLPEMLVYRWDAPLNIHANTICEAFCTV